MTETGPLEIWSDEELPQPRRTLPGGPWPLRLLGIVAVVIAVVAVVVRGGGSSPAPSAVRTVVAARSIAVQPRPAVLPGRLYSTLTESALGLLSPPECPAADDGQVACTTVRALPRAFGAAVRAVLPGVHRASVITELLRPTGPESLQGIWSRRYTAHAAAMTIRIVVAQPVGGTALARAGSDDGRRAMLYVAHRVGRYTVAVDVEAPSGRAPSFARLDRLAVDARLLALH